MPWSIDHTAAPVVLAASDEVAPGGMTVEWARSSSGLAWAVANGTGHDQPVWAVRLSFDLGPVPDPLRLLSHGWQSWSATRPMTLGVDHDPASNPGIPALLRQLTHADAEAPPFGELRSELVTVLRAPGLPLLLVGFDAAENHDGTLRVARSANGNVVLTVEAFLGGAVLAPHERRVLHGVSWREGEDHDVLLANWADRLGAAMDARTEAPYRVGWCSWYHWFTTVTEADIDDNLAAAGSWPFEVFQVDDGYQHDIGDWLTTNDTFPSGVAHLAQAIRARGYSAGLWMAPFVAMASSDLAREHPDWLATWHDGRPLVGNRNPAWGGDALVLDVTRPDVLDHLEHVARELVGLGFDYLKLDFLYAAHVPGRYLDRSSTPAQRVRRALEAIRRGAGPDTFLLGCGCPIGSAVGIVDGMRIGPDVDPSWGLAPHHRHAPDGYRDTPPSTRNGWQATLARSWMHRRLWLNDPDCLMLRHGRTAMSADQIQAWTGAVAMSGGMALVSDDLGMLGEAERQVLDEVIDLGRAADDGARAGRSPRVPDLLDTSPPTTIEAAGHRLILLDVEAGTTLLT